MASAVNPTRRYDSPRRREQAAATREAILGAAQSLFQRDGYAATTVPAIAAEAGVALKTVYVAFGTKAALLRSLWDQRLAEDEARTPVLQRRWFLEVVEAAEPQEKLRLVARQSRVVKARSGPLLEVVRAAAAVDPEIAQLWEDIQAKLLHVARALAGHLDEQGALRPDRPAAAAADVLWALNHPAMWQLLVRERRWSAQRYEDWLAEAFCAELLG